LLLRRQSLLSGSFLAVAGAIVANGLLLQPRPHPAPLVVTRDDAEPPAAPADELVMAVQQALRTSGYYSGPIDGVAGPQTRSAIRAFEAATTGRPGSGEITTALLATLTEARSGDTAALTELAAVESVAPDATVAAVQHALSISAYGPLQADGIPGPQTREAIVRFQRDHGLPLTGEITDELIVELRAAGALQDQPPQDHALQDR
jgi:peptidoglycan hydrolase-like protein with peptidoglycan-binding domain